MALSLAHPPECHLGFTSSTFQISLSSSLCMSVWHPSSSFTPIVDLVKGFRSAPFISLVIAVNVDKSLAACLLLEYDFYFVFSVYLGQKVGCILTLGECVCACVCAFLSPKHTNIHLTACVCATRVHTNLHPHAEVCVHRAPHTSPPYAPHTHTPTLQLSEALCAFVYVCPYAHCSICVCAYTGTSATPINIPSPPSRGCMQL